MKSRDACGAATTCTRVRFPRFFGMIAFSKALTRWVNVLDSFRLFFLPRAIIDTFQVKDLCDEFFPVVIFDEITEGRTHCHNPMSAAVGMRIAELITSMSRAISVHILNISKGESKNLLLSTPLISLICYRVKLLFLLSHRIPLVNEPLERLL